jgi:hypothetical protein
MNPIRPYKLCQSILSHMNIPAIPMCVATEVLFEMRRPAFMAQLMQDIPAAVASKQPPKKWLPASVDERVSPPRHS